MVTASQDGSEDDEEPTFMQYFKREKSSGDSKASSSEEQPAPQPQFRTVLFVDQQFRMALVNLKVIF